MYRIDSGATKCGIVVANGTYLSYLGSLQLKFLFHGPSFLQASVGQCMRFVIPLQCWHR